jgi:hypothetical protein
MDSRSVWAVFGENIPFRVSKLGSGNSDSISNLASKSASLRVGILPVTLSAYQESPVCDSCRWLSENGVEFVLEHGLLRGLDSVWEHAQVERVLPFDPLIEEGPDTLASTWRELPLPWNSWFGDSLETSSGIIWRPRDFLSASETRKRLDAIGGALGLDRLVIVQEAKVSVYPSGLFSNRGDLKIGFNAAAYAVAEGHFLWAFQFQETQFKTDLNENWEPWLMKFFQKAYEELPPALSQIRNQEPH